MHLLQVQKSSLDDPAADRTASVVPPNSAFEGANAHWLVQKKNSNALAQRSSLDDPPADRTVSVIKPNTVQEEDLTIWLVQKKKLNKQAPKPAVNGFVLMDDNLASEYAVYAQDDDTFELDTSAYPNFGQTTTVDANDTFFGDQKLKK